jgi:hypothetical protein
MKHIFLFLFAVLIVSCSTNSNSEKKENKPQKDTIAVRIEKPIIPKDIDYMAIDSAIRPSVQTLDSMYGRTPYFALFENKKIFIVLKGKFDPKTSYNSDALFSGNYKYGIFNELLKPVLAFEYDKIYNPNLTVHHCMEIKKEGKIGLYNFITQEILEPQFEYIVPSSERPDNTAYGFKAGTWFKIDNTKTFRLTASNFSPVDAFSKLSFVGHTATENMLYDSYSIDATEKVAYGAGVVITPSYIEHLDIIPEICNDLITPSSKDKGFGTDELYLRTDTTRSITDQVISFIVSFYKQGVDGREYLEDEKKVIVFNKEKKTFHSGELEYKYSGYDAFCKVIGHRFVNDSTIEVLQQSVDDRIREGRYDFENTFTYKLITKNGEVKNLSDNRYYSFTKYVEINENYFKGCFATFVDQAYQTDSGNVWVSEHLTLEDMDLMMNEIYAEYGFRFKSEKWMTYFSQFDWYKPRFDNVDNKFNPIDKKNIETIAKEKAKMKGKENDFVKKHLETFSAAG